MTAQEFINEIKFPIVWFTSIGEPTGQSIAVLDETYFPFDLSAIEGEVDSNGVFEASNLNDGSGIRGWKFNDFARNTVFKLQIYSNQKEWESQYEEWLNG